MSEYVPDAGDLVKVGFDVERAGHEQAGWRPAIVLSPKAYNRKTGMVLVAPITNQVKGYPFEVVLPPGLKIQGAILADQLRTLDWRMRGIRPYGAAPARVLQDVRAKLAVLLGLPKP